jgi:hypothetical protein
MDFARAFRSDPLRHEGVRPINIWGLRLFYLVDAQRAAPDQGQARATSC